MEVVKYFESSHHKSGILFGRKKAEKKGRQTRTVRNRSRSGCGHLGEGKRAG